MTGVTSRTNNSMMFKRIPFIQTFLNKRGLPVIPVNASDVELLSSPSQFYDYLLQRLEIFQTRATLSALYLGTGFKESHLVEILKNKLTHEPAKKVSVLLDHHRAQRLNSASESSVTLLEPLSTFTNFGLCLMKPRDEVSILDKVQKLNELQSTYHAKFCIFDQDVLITGANLSDIYFENRQDRYMVIRNSLSLSSYLVDLTINFNKEQPLGRSVQNLNLKYVSLSNTSADQSDTYVIPLVQHKPSHLTSIDDFLGIIAGTSSTADIHMSTGYFNPGSIVSSLNFRSILVPSEKSNGFYGGNGLLRHIPRLYTQIYRSYNEHHPECDVHLYDKPGWSFHAKGIWINYHGGPYLHIVGSSNFNLRSSERDLEFQLVIVTANQRLIDRFEDEREKLWSNSSRLNIENIPLHDKRYEALLPFLRSFM